MIWGDKLLKILVSEDESSTRETYEAILKHEGHDVFTTCDGQECIDIYKKEFEKRMQERGVFDIVLLDYSLPKKNGAAVVKEILKLNQEQKVLMATAYSRPQIEKDLNLEQKNIRIIQKPFELAELMQVLNEMVSD